MAHITLAGVLLDPTGEFAVGDKVRFTHKSTTGETIMGAISVLTVPPNGAYSIDLEYGLVFVEYMDYRRGQWCNLGVATVNATNPATSIPELLNALVPVSSAELIEFQAILADCVAAENNAASSAAAALVSETNAANSAASIDEDNLIFVYDTVAEYQASTKVWAIGKVLKIKERDAEFAIISGTSTSDGYAIIGNTTTGQSANLSSYDVNIINFGADNTGGTDVAPLLRSVIRSGVNITVPEGDYLFDSTLGSVVGVASAPCVTLNGISNITIKGFGLVRFLMGSNMTSLNNNFFTCYVSQAMADAGNYNINIKMSNFELVFNRDPSLIGNISGINTTSTESFIMENITFNAEENNAHPVLAVPGTGGLGNRYNNNKFIGVATCFDNSQMFSTVWKENICVSGSSPITAFNHFYDLITQNNVRFSRDVPTTLSSGNSYLNNEVSGYPSAFNIRGMQDFSIDTNVIHSYSGNSSSDNACISVYTGSQEGGIGENVKGVNITSNKINGFSNAGTGTARAISVNRSSYEVYGVLIAFNIVRNSDVGVSQLGGETKYDQILGNNIDISTVNTPYSNDVIEITTGSTGLSPLITSGRDIELETGAGRHVRFGFAIPESDKPITSYVEIRDLAGTVRKLAVID